MPAPLQRFPRAVHVLFALPLALVCACTAQAGTASSERPKLKKLLVAMRGGAHPDRAWLLEQRSTGPSNVELSVDEARVVAAELAPSDAVLVVTGLPNAQALTPPCVAAVCSSAAALVDESLKVIPNLAHGHSLLDLGIRIKASPDVLYDPVVAAQLANLGLPRFVVGEHAPGILPADPRGFDMSDISPDERARGIDPLFVAGVLRSVVDLAEFHLAGVLSPGASDHLRTLRNSLNANDVDLAARGILTHGERVERVSELARISSSSRDLKGLAKARRLVTRWLRNDVGLTARVVPASLPGFGDHLLFYNTFDANKPTILLPLHVDTVHPARALISYGASDEGGRVPNPFALAGSGVLDMGVGIVNAIVWLQHMRAERLLDKFNIVGLLVADEERASESSRALIEAAANGTLREYLADQGRTGRLPARAVDAAFGTEFSIDGEGVDERLATVRWNWVVPANVSIAQLMSKIWVLNGAINEGHRRRVNVLADLGEEAPEGLSFGGGVALALKSDGAHSGARTKGGPGDTVYAGVLLYNTLVTYLAAKHPDVTLAVRRFSTAEGGENPNTVPPRTNVVFEFYTRDGKLPPELMHDVSSLLTTSDAARATIELVEDLTISLAENHAPLPTEPKRVNKLIGDARFINPDDETPFLTRLHRTLGEGANIEVRRPPMLRNEATTRALNDTGLSRITRPANSAADINFVGDAIKLEILTPIGAGAHGAHEWAWLMFDPQVSRAMRLARYLAEPR